MPGGRTDANYTGLHALGGFATPPESLAMILGRRGFFGDGLADHRRTARSLMWWRAIPGAELAARSDDDLKAMLLDVHRGW